MYEHRLARENEYRGKVGRNQFRGVANALEAYNGAMKTAGHLRLKSDATNMRRIYFHQGEAKVPRPEPACQVGEAVEGAERPLSITGKYNFLNLDVEPGQTRRRPRCLTRYAAHIVREGCAVVESAYGKKAFFVTLTLPGRSEDAIRVFAEESTSILNRFMQRLRNLFCCHKIELDAVGVWEPHADGTLHFHLCIGVKDEKVKVFLRRHIRRLWRKVLLTQSKKSGVDLFERKNGATWKDDPSKPVVQFAKVKKTVGAYMGRYLSKHARVAERLDFTPPARWWYLSDALREKLIQQRNLCALRLVSIEDAEQVACELVGVAESYGATVKIMRNPFTTNVCGFVIFGRRETLAEMDEMLREVMHAIEHGAEHDVLSDEEEERTFFYPDESRTEAEIIFDGKPLLVVA